MRRVVMAQPLDLILAGVQYLEYDSMAEHVVEIAAQIRAAEFTASAVQHEEGDICLDGFTGGIAVQLFSACPAKLVPGIVATEVERFVHVFHAELFSSVPAGEVLDESFEFVDGHSMAYQSYWWLWDLP